MNPLHQQWLKDYITEHRDADAALRPWWRGVQAADLRYIADYRELLTTIQPRPVTSQHQADFFHVSPALFFPRHRTTRRSDIL
jgi:hypothetical protein